MIPNDQKGPSNTRRSSPPEAHWQDLRIHMMQVVPLLGFVTLTAATCFPTEVILASWKERSGVAGEQGQDEPQKLLDLILNPGFSFELKSHILFGPQCFFLSKKEEMLLILQGSCTA